MNLNINNAILHVLDVGVGRPILSDQCLSFDDKVLNYLQNHVMKCIEDDSSKKCIFREHSNFLERIKDIPVDFVGTTKQIANCFYKVMTRNPAIPCSDLVCLLCSDSSGEAYFAVLKMNYHDGFTHYYQQENNNHYVSIITQQTLLPNITSKVEEAFVIDLSSHELWLKEKKIEIDGVKDYYLSSYILDCKPSVAEREKFIAVKKAIKKVNRDLLGGQKDIEREVLSKMHNQLSASEEVAVSELCYEVYSKYPNAMNMLQGKLTENNINMSDTIKVSPKTLKQLEKHSFKASSGIEIKIPVELYRDDRALEFINNPDGTISILVKNVLI